MKICFLGPDGSGKSTIIEQLLIQELAFKNKEYFHLKPLKKKISIGGDAIVTDPHGYPPYSRLKSYIKLLYYVCQYNLGWLKNIFLPKVKSRLVIFDRYFDDILVDSRRYRYGGSLAIARITRRLIPRPDIYFIFTADAAVIYKRKQEVAFKELERQIKVYEAMADSKWYFLINVNRPTEEITKEVISIIMKKKINGRY